MSTCNYCNHKAALRGVKERCNVVVKKPATWGMGGVTFYEVPPHEVKDFEPREEDPYFIAWYMELPSHCCC